MNQKSLYQHSSDVSNTRTKKENKERLRGLQKAGENICHIVAAVAGAGNESVFWSDGDGGICSGHYSSDCLQSALLS